jgi:threonine synthase
LGAPARPISFCVPSGNFGDAFAGYVASRMGLPVARIVVATNSNDILAGAFETGRYVRGQVRATMSPAMDIQSASNFERLFFEATGRNAAATAEAFEGFNATGAINVPAPALAEMRKLFRGVGVSEDATAKAIMDTYENARELIDPHTAVAVSALERVADVAGPVVLLSTAHAAKFPEDVARIAGVAPQLPPGTADLADRPERFARLPAEAEAIKAHVRAFAGA